MGALVIKSWQADAKGIDDKGTLVRITGRKSGVIGFVLALLGIDPVTKVIIDSERLQFSWASVSGIEYRVIPLANICSTYYGFNKPWRTAVGILAVFLAAGYCLAQVMALEGGSTEGLVAWGWVTLVGTAVSLIYYALNRRMTLGFVESSGVVDAIAFKRSVIENVTIDDIHASTVSMIVQRCIEAKLRQR